MESEKYGMLWAHNTPFSQKVHFSQQSTMILLENPRWRTLTCSIHRVCDNFATNLSHSYWFIYLQTLFNRTIYKSKMYETWRVIMVANVATNFWILVTSMVNLDALAIVSGTISCPEVRCPTHCHNYKGAASESNLLTAHNNQRKNVKS